MKPRAMSVWIASAASSAVSPRVSVQARVSVGPAVKNVIRSAAAKISRSTDSSADGPSRNSAASSGGISASSASSLRSIPPGPFSIRTSGFVVSGSSSRGSSPGYSESGCPASACASTRSSSETSSRRRGSPDFACWRTRSSRPSTWSRSETTSSSKSASRSAAASRVPENASTTPSSASVCRRLPSSVWPVPGTSMSSSATGVIFAELSIRGDRLEPLVGDRHRPDRPVSAAASAPRTASTGLSRAAPRSQHEARL